jgi:splicing factor 3A subunit 2
MSFISAREHGSKPGSAGVASHQQEAIDRRDRLRRLALESVDLARDPYYLRNHLGQIECRLCLTVHPNEGNYLAHTQGKKHQQGLAKRAALDAQAKAAQQAAAAAEKGALGRRVAIKRSAHRIGRPGYRVTKQFDPATRRRALLFQIDYPEIALEQEDQEEGAPPPRPRHRFMSAYEQRIEPADRAWQYVVFACEPYETIAFKVPAAEVVGAAQAGARASRVGAGGKLVGGLSGGDGGGGTDGPSLFWHWDPDAKVYSLQVPFRLPRQGMGMMMPPPPPPPPPQMPVMGAGMGMMMPPPPLPPPPPPMPPPPPYPMMGGGMPPPMPPRPMPGGGTPPAMLIVMGGGGGMPPPPHGGPPPRGMPPPPPPPPR